MVLSPFASATPRRRNGVAVVASLTACAAAALAAALAPVAPVQAAGAARLQAATPEILDIQFGNGMQVKVPVPKNVDSGAYESTLQNLYNLIIAANMPLNRYITPADVVVMCPAGSKKILPAAPKGKTKTAAQALAELSAPVNEKTLNPNGTYTIYVMGRKFLVVDAVMAKAMKATDSKTLALKLARQCQQTFPRVCFRPPSLPDNIVPSNPPLALTTNIARCVAPDITARVELWGTPLMAIAGPQTDGSTAPDRAYALSQRVVQVIGRPGIHLPDEVVVKSVPLPGKPAQAQIMVGTKVLFTLTVDDARANKSTTAVALAEKISETIKGRLAESAPTAPVVPAESTPAAPTAAPVTTEPTPAPTAEPASTPAPAPTEPSPASPAPASPSETPAPAP